VDDVLEQIRPVIEPGESVLWSGRSDPAVMLTAADGYLIPFSLFFAGFSVFWVIGLSHAPNSGPFALFGLPFVVIGAYYLIGRFVVKRRLKLRTAYAITNRRAIVLVGRRNLHESRLAGGDRVLKTSRNGEHITVTFNGPAAPSSSFFFNTRSQIYPNTGLDPFDFAHRFPVAFYDVADVEGLKSALAKVSAPTTTTQS
jgi:hypothetical protein